VFEACLAGFADGFSAAVVFVVGGDVADAGVQPDGVVVDSGDGELGAQGGRVQAWSVGVPGRPKCWAIAHNAMNSRVEPDVIWGPLSETASRIGLAWSSTPMSTRPSSWRASTFSSSPSTPRAAVKASSTWVDVSSTETISVIHLRETRSSMISTAIPALVKWVVS